MFFPNSSFSVAVHLVNVFNRQIHDELESIIHIVNYNVYNPELSQPFCTKF